MNFNDLPLNVPDIKKVARFFRTALADLKAANDAESVTKVMKRINKFGSDISTDITVIQIRFSIDTTNEVYKAANDKLSEILSRMIYGDEQWKEDKSGKKRK